MDTTGEQAAVGSPALPQRQGDAAPRRGRSAAARALPGGDLLVGALVGDAVAVLDAIEQLVAVAGDPVEIGFGQLRPAAGDLGAGARPGGAQGDPVLVRPV